MINQSASETPRRESHHHVWTMTEEDIQSNDIDFLTMAFREQSRRWGLSEVILSKTADGEISLYQSVNQKADVPHILIAAGFHGEEPAGCWGILDFLRHGSPEMFDNLAVSFLPLVNLSGLRTGSRLNSAGQNPNRGFTQGAEVEPSIEGKILLKHQSLLKDAASHGVLCCHEDILCREAYLYTLEHAIQPGYFSVALRDELERFFPVLEKEHIDGCECENGIIFNHFDSSFESWLFSSCSEVAACTETPGLQSFAKRIEANRCLIGAFISLIRQRNSSGDWMP